MIQDRNKFKGIVRNKLHDLNRLKGKKKVPLKRFSKKALRKAIQDEQVINSSLLSSSTKTSQIEMSNFDEPIWIDHYKECCSILKEIEQEIAREKMKKLTSINQKKHDKVIQQFVEEASLKLNKCQKKIKQMEHLNNFNNEESAKSKKTFTHILISTATNVRNQARRLREQQQSQLHREKQFKNLTKNVVQQADLNQKLGDFDNWLSENEFQMMENNIMKQRDEQINKMVKSIYSLNTLYKELQSLVIEQGSLLDRIDENIDNTVESTIQANKHLQSACKKQESKCFIKLRIILIVLIFFMLLIIIMKHT